MLEPLPTIRQRQPADSPLARNLPARAAFKWLRAGWRDLRSAPAPSLAYGVFVVLLSYAVLWGLSATGLLYLALPAVAGFLIVGPFLAIGLYAKSHRQSEGEKVTLMQMVLARPTSGPQLAYAGLMLGLLALFWLRAADLLYALFLASSRFPVPATPSSMF